MARKQSLIPCAVPPQITDDLTLIRGIGPVLAGRLRDASIHTYEELASMSPATLAACLGELSVKQITRQNLIGQARKMATQKTRSKVDKRETLAPAARQHYANFTIEFLLDERNEGRRTRIVHVQSGDADSWTGLGTEQLINFLVRHTGLHDPRKKLTFNKSDAVRGKPLQMKKNESKPVIRSPEPPMIATAPISGHRSAETVSSVLQPPEVVDPADTLQVRDLKVTLPGSDIPIFFLHQGQPYVVQLTLDQSNGVAPRTTALVHKTTVIFKQVGGPCESVLEANGALGLSNTLSLHLSGTNLAPGVYRLSAFVGLAGERALLGPTAFLKGGLFQVY
jgi:hypothetical protein